jgi:hypothetical protein
MGRPSPGQIDGLRRLDETHRRPHNQGKSKQATHTVYSLCYGGQVPTERAKRNGSFDLDQGDDPAPGKGCLEARQEGSAMPDKIDDLLPTAKEIQKQTALKEAEKAEQYARLQAAAEAEKRKLIEKLSKPSGLTEEEKVKLASTVIQRAVRNGLTEVQVYRFPRTLCTDNGRAINQQEPGWEQTLTGIPLEMYRLWDKYFRPRGYKFRAEIVSYPDGVPGDVGITLAWS